MEIAVLLGEVGFVSHKGMMNGILDSALIDNSNVYLFTCEGWYSHTQHDDAYDGELAEYKIFELPDFDRYDGIIVDLDTIHNSETYELIVEKIKHTKVPCVLINTVIDSKNCFTIKIENRTGIESMVNHLAACHNIKDMCYISGPLYNRDATERKEAFMEVAGKNGIVISEDNILYGDFEYKSGKQLIEEYLAAGRKLPEAFVCANDFMAIGVVNSLQDAGYTVPDDVVVTGYDNINMAQCIEPNLTTVIRGEYDAGEKAYKTLKEGFARAKNREKIIYGKMTLGSSCGCIHGKRTKKKNSKLVVQQIKMDNNLEILKLTTIRFSGMNTFSDFSNCVKRYIENMNIDYFYLCFCGSRELYEEDMRRILDGEAEETLVETYTDKAWIPLAFENGQWKTYDAFDTKELLPSERDRKNGIYHIVLPVHHGSFCIGYCVVGHHKNVDEGRFIQHLVLNINTAIGNVRKQDIMRRMIDRINGKWIYDELTGLYNRAGFKKYSQDYIKKAYHHGKRPAVIFIDLDGLKNVNDTYGHDEGDKYIKSMAHVMKQCGGKDDILVRYGGDEYIILTEVDGTEEVTEYISDLQNKITEHNYELQANKLSASIGFCIGGADEHTSLKEMIEAADEQMYKIKKEKTFILK